MIKLFINSYLTKKIKLACQKKWKKIILANGEYSTQKQVQEKYFSLWKPLSKKVELYYLKYYSKISGIEQYNYTPEDLYYTKIEPTLNNKSFALAYSDKNFYQRFLTDVSDIFPQTIVRSINKTIFNSEYNCEINTKNVVVHLKENTSYIFKSSVETSGGQDVFFISRDGNKLLIKDSNKDNQNISFETLHTKYPNFIIQEKIKQHAWFSAFNKSSVNTLRVYTYRSVVNENVHVLSCVLRFGQKGQLVDNQAAGGLTIGINKDGLLNNFICNKYGRVKNNNNEFSDLFLTKVPMYDKIEEYAKKIAPSYYYHRLLGFDFCVTENNEVKLLEINCKNIEINFLQMNNGPLFGEYSKEIIDYCLHTKKNVVIDFNI